ncbi:putative small heat shock protein [Candidatus Kuenenia stuttgartiensis]|jgi:HSP20 family protein|uniref:Putative small heat shock protein n=1 Tax=Kuenenia stuttgartiensis TaxID=174633 RepID=Q1Q6Q1_KUEST|nr:MULTISPECIES: Hsp20/alpha crystallin family protein [Kuenenia]MBE7548910.1 Hsp20/alpha crystallin family protein [Planctomycetia bacterium]MBW7942251.1 Hsp20/alpha crystallin family protein [Candidatus Kuenenia stuttgartiensis]MBZ0192539.1 Hsp20/alpha crystallin family protein [Candidatus Kuenenia stuttgartiensis]MCF6153594.1 Hsp20/alpha crystallin family protein [Candidatus Kuenenia stuttgartiensis]MCL4728434.1 Hsp20/alpha crystallin family protein [Candidatus Kuenenia stuttgartiensis]
MMMPLSRTLETLLGLQEALDLTRDAGFFENGTASSGVYPPVNIFEKNGDLVLVAELPGVKKEDLNIEVKENILRLSGTRTIDYGKNVSYHRIERNFSEFDRTLRLPFNIESEKVQAEYKEGLLVVSLPRAETDKPKKIAIQ